MCNKSNHIPGIIDIEFTP
jgi:hypothetical protein